MHIHFRIGALIIDVSSHGYFTICAEDVPAGGPLPGCLQHGSIEPLNETWANDGREPLQLEPWDDGMPDLEDPRLERCVRTYVQKHDQRLQESLKRARAAWEQMRNTPVDVEGTLLMPGQRVRGYYAKDGIREHAKDEGERVFLGYGAYPGEQEKRLFFTTVTHGLKGTPPRPWRFWIEPIAGAEESGESSR
ncbi:MAG TPA: hypothetical protein VH370_08825 [Humisphaera sp.]|jgi:hypothetical protein|nr:hypothetical protein [Humisphaera sp.]